MRLNFIAKIYGFISLENDSSHHILKQKIVCQKGVRSLLHRYQTAKRRKFTRWSMNSTVLIRDTKNVEKLRTYLVFWLISVIEALHPFHSDSNFLKISSRWGQKGLLWRLYEMKYFIYYRSLQSLYSKINLQISWNYLSKHFLE